MSPSLCMYDSFQLHVIPIHCEDSRIYHNDHDHVFKLLRDPLGNMRDKLNRTLISELQFVLKHVNKKHNEVVFTKCFDLIKSDQLYTFLQQFNYRLPNPQFSTDHSGHYKAFIEICQLPLEEQLF